MLENIQQLSLVERFSKQSLHEPPKEGVEKFLAQPGVSNLLGRWLKVSNRGIYDEAQMITEPIRKERAELRVIGQEMIRKLDTAETFTESEQELCAPSPTSWSTFRTSCRRRWRGGRGPRRASYLMLSLRGSGMN